MSENLQENDGTLKQMDEVLCFSRLISYETFRNFVWANPRATFEEACKGTGVGSKCTACLLNAQEFYLECQKNRPDGFKGMQESNLPSFRFGKADLYRLIDKFSPKAPFLLKGVIPTFGGENIKTTLRIANSVFDPLGPKSPTFRLEIECRDHDGRILDEHDLVLPPYERFDLNVSDQLTGGAEGILTGSCRVKMSALKPGYRGSIRPHFTVETPCGATALHSQGGGKYKPNPMITRMTNAEESQCISLVNCEDVRADVSIRIHQKGKTIEAIEHSAAPFAASMVEIGTPAVRQACKDGAVFVELNSTARVRPHMVVRYGTPPRLSLDHM